MGIRNGVFMFKKLQFYPIKIMFTFILWFLALMIEDDIVFPLVMFASFIYLLVIYFTMSIQSSKQIRVLKNQKKNLHELEDIVHNIRKYWKVPIFVLVVIALFFALFIFTIFVTFIIGIELLLMYTWIGRIRETGY